MDYGQKFQKEKKKRISGMLLQLFPHSALCWVLCPELGTLPCAGYSALCWVLCPELGALSFAGYSACAGT